MHDRALFKIFIFLKDTIQFYNLHLVQLSSFECWTKLIYIKLTQVTVLSADMPAMNQFIIIMEDKTSMAFTVSNSAAGVSQIRTF